MPQLRSSRLSSILVITVLLGAGVADAAPGREVFRGHVMGNTKLTTLVGSIPFSSTGVGGNIQLTFDPAETTASRERPGAILVKLGTPITYKIKTTATLSLP